MSRSRELAIDALLHRLILAKEPNLTMIELQTRTTTVINYRGYTVFLDGEFIAKITLESQDRFTVDLKPGG